MPDFRITFHRDGPLPFRVSIGRVVVAWMNNYSDAEILVAALREKRDQYILPEKM